jgi:hypothetical protein
MRKISKSFTGIHIILIYSIFLMQNFTSIKMNDATGPNDKAGGKRSGRRNKPGQQPASGTEDDLLLAKARLPRFQTWEAVQEEVERLERAEHESRVRKSEQQAGLKKGQDAKESQKVGVGRGEGGAEEGYGSEDSDKSNGEAVDGEDDDDDEDEDEDDDDDAEENDEEDDDDDEDEDDEDDDEEDDEDEEDEEGEEQHEDDEEEAVVVHDEKKFVVSEEDLEFERMLSKVMSESVEKGKVTSREGINKAERMVGPGIVLTPDSIKEAVAQAPLTGGQVRAYIHTFRGL